LNQGTYATLLDKPKFILLADELYSKLYRVAKSLFSEFGLYYT